MTLFAFIVVICELELFKCSTIPHVNVFIVQLIKLKRLQTSSVTKLSHSTFVKMIELHFTFKYLILPLVTLKESNVYSPKSNSCILPKLQYKCLFSNENS
ncbi:hypothetical protein KM1_165140 [Entamoeba histolytica HM-3:IMSS]|uniref:Uncharacterized protein n=1 Tax=Entamoeba histolytica HM-3:IMSS TaxID=885315 RepID=M7WLL0_ENTHI|nr:hypothetical protein KM1_165140 [Entamoeba histolytica HM-3:IMSS]